MKSVTSFHYSLPLVLFLLLVSVEKLASDKNPSQGSPVFIFCVLSHCVIMLLKSLIDLKRQAVVVHSCAGDFRI